MIPGRAILSSRTARIAALLLLLAGCSAPGQAPVERGGGGGGARPSPPVRVDTNAEFYTVQRGDTLYAISWTFGLNWKELAALNNIGPPWTIFPGQRLRVRAARSGGRRPAPRPSPPVAAKPPNRDAGKPKPPPAPTEPKQWVWPAEGPVASAYGSNNKGLDIVVDPGDPVVAAAAGDVVYAGKGIRGLGLLVIVRHSDKLLSAYGHSGKIMVEEGRRVRAGDRLAEAGERTTQNLHFEIRRDGKPINPASVLPRR